MPTTYRATCADLVARLRRYAGDTSSPQFFTDDDLQDILDRHRIAWRQWELTPERTMTQGGIYNFTDYFARGEGGTWQIGDWEQGYVLQWGDWSILTPATADENTGHWTFSLPPPGQIPPVFITGYSYDLAGAAAECWERRAAALFEKFDASAQGMNARRSQMYDHCCDRAEHFRMQQRPELAALVRTDVISDLRGLYWRPGHALS